MSSLADTLKDPNILTAAGLPADAVSAWLAATPKLLRDYAEDCRNFSRFWLQSNRLIGLLPSADRRNTSEQAAAASIINAARKARTQFLRHHVESVYGALTSKGSRRLRIEHLVLAAAEAVPGLVPGKADLAAEEGRLQRDRSGLEIDHAEPAVGGEGAGRVEPARPRLPFHAAAAPGSSRSPEPA